MPPLLSFLLFFPLLTLSSPLPFPTVTQPPTTNDASLTIIGSWTLSSFARSCSPVDNLCNYAFDLQEGPKPSRDLYTCFMSANGTSQTDFSRIECAGFGDRFLVNGGWNGQGTRAFLTLVVTDQVVGGYAFFGIAEGSFDEGMYFPPFCFVPGCWCLSAAVSVSLSSIPKRGNKIDRERG